MPELCSLRDIMKFQDSDDPSKTMKILISENGMDKAIYFVVYNLVYVMGFVLFFWAVVNDINYFEISSKNRKKTKKLCP